MSNISKLKDGGFYYVDKLYTVDEMFIDALGGALFSGSNWCPDCSKSKQIKQEVCWR